MKTCLSTPILTAMMLSAGLLSLSPAQAEESFELRQSAIGLRVTSMGQLSLSSGSLSFFNLPAGQTSASASVLLSNTGSQPLTIDGMAVQGGDGAGGFFFGGTTCGEELEPGQSCTASVYAVGQGVNRSGSFTILAGNAGTRTNRLQLFSSPNEDPALAPAAPPPSPTPEPQPELQANLSLSTTSVNFGSVATNTTETRQVLATNTGDGSLSWTAAPTVSGNAAFSAGATACGASLAAGQSCVTDVTFSPTAVGTFNGTLTFTSALANSPHQVSLVGTAFNPVSLASATLPAATVGQAYSFDFKPLLNVSNEASPDRSLATWSVLSGTLPAGLSVNSATGVLSGTPSSVNAGASFTVQGTYKNNQGQQVYTIVVNGLFLQAIDVVTGSNHSCALTEQGVVFCWGENFHGQIGDGTTVDRVRPVQVQGLPSSVNRLVTGGNHNCALLDNGSVWCWGLNIHRQLGDGSFVEFRPAPVQVSALGAGSVTRISASSFNTCAVTVEGAAMCWGANNNSQIGDGTTVTRPVPTQVSGLASGVWDITAGGGYACAVLTNGSAWCWGNNGSGQLGDGTQQPKSTPVQVSGLSSGVSSLVASKSGSHTCAILSTGALRCWGFNIDGQLGINNTNSRTIPTQVTGLTSGITQVSLGSVHTCALRDSGELFCWGSNRDWRLGVEDTPHSALQPGPRLTPVSIPGFPGPVQRISAGNRHSCAISENSVFCWGFNGNGQIGDGFSGSVTVRTTPGQVLAP